MRTIQERNLISVIIPTRDAADGLPAALAALRDASLVGETIVVDGGSRDDTVSIARDAGVRVVVAARGRGPQLAAGAAAASGAWLLFLHADCWLEAGWQVAARDFLEAPEAAQRAGYFRLALDDVAPAARRLERLVAWRCRVLGLPYGDQGLLISRTLYEDVGGFAPIPLMEDVDLTRRIGRRRLVALDASCVASARRYRRDGYWRRSSRNLLCLSLYFAGVAPRHVARLYG